MKKIFIILFFLTSANFPKAQTAYELCFDGWYLNQDYNYLYSISSPNIELSEDMFSLFSPCYVDGNSNAYLEFTIGDQAFSSNIFSLGLSEDINNNINYGFKLEESNGTIIANIIFEGQEIDCANGALLSLSASDILKVERNNGLLNYYLNNTILCQFDGIELLDLHISITKKEGVISIQNLRTDIAGCECITLNEQPQETSMWFNNYGVSVSVLGFESDFDLPISDPSFNNPNTALTIYGNLLIDRNSTYVNHGKFNNKGIIAIQHKIVNNSVSSFELSSSLKDGVVDLFGNNQTIEGSTSISFPNLTLSNPGIKDFYIDASTCSNCILNLFDAELSTNTNTFTINSSLEGAIVRNFGFVSSLENGLLIRTIDATHPNYIKYLFPLGSSLNGTYLYRPIEMSNYDIVTNYFDPLVGARLIKNNPNDDNRFITEKLASIESLNTNFYYELNEIISTSNKYTFGFYYNEFQDGIMNSLAKWQNITTIPSNFNVSIYVPPIINNFWIRQLTTEKINIPSAFVQEGLTHKIILEDIDNFDNFAFYDLAKSSISITVDNDDENEVTVVVTGPSGTGIESSGNDFNTSVNETEIIEFDDFINDTDNDGIPDDYDSDIGNDGVVDVNVIDQDSDGINDDYDSDIGNDGVVDVNVIDQDFDGIIDAAETDPTIPINVSVLPDENNTAVDVSLPVNTSGCIDEESITVIIDGVSYPIDDELVSVINCSEITFNSSPIFLVDACESTIEISVSEGVFEVNGIDDISNITNIEVFDADGVPTGNYTPLSNQVLGIINSGLYFFKIQLDFTSTPLIKGQFIIQ